MAASGKIRVLLVLLCASLFVTAVIVQKTYTPVNNLEQTAKTLENNLHKKEHYVDAFLDDPIRLNELRELPTHPQLALNYIKYFTTNNSIWFITLKNNQLSFWSGVKVIPDHPEFIKNGYSFLKLANGYYDVVKKTNRNFSVIFFIPVKPNYAFQNQYLQNTFANDLIKDNNIEIADFTDKNIYEIHSINNSYLFSVKAKPDLVNHTFFYYELTIWLLALLCACVLMGNVCNYIASKGYLAFALIFLATFIIVLRYINLHYNLPNFTYRLEIFNPAIYGSSYTYPSLGDFCINILFITWFVVFLYKQRRRFLKKIPGKVVSYFILVVGIASLIFISASFLNLFYGLVINSKISFDVSNVLNLSLFSLIGVLMLCFSFLVFYLLNEIFLTIAIKLPVPNSHKILLFVLGIIIASLITVYHHVSSLFYLLLALIAFIRAYAYRYRDGYLNSTAFGLIILICAFISSIKLSHFEDVKEKEIRKAYIQKLEVPDDANADDIFKKIEQQVVTDTSIIHYFKDSLYNADYVKTRLQKLYFNGYLSKYEFNVHEFNSEDKPLSADKNYDLNDFKDEVLYSSYKVSNYFYRENQSFGFLNYFAIIPIYQNKKNLGTIVVELKTKPLQSFASFPGLLIDGQVNIENEFKGYSYAFYIDNKLLSQSGSYVYDLTNRDLQGKLKKYVFVNTSNDKEEWYLRFITYSHLIYKPSERNLIVVSKEENELFFGITSITFFFVIFLVFGVFILTARWLWLRIKILKVKNDSMIWSFKLNLERVLYKTRIQFSMVFAVVATLIIVGFITFFSISAQYQDQQDKTIREKISRIVRAFEGGQVNKYLTNNNEESQVQFDEFANIYLADLTLFDLNGTMMISTQPKIYEFGLLARRMNGRAYIALNKLQKSEYVNNEIIGKLNYKAAYLPVRNSKNETIAYLELPYFSNETDYKERIGALLNVMINVYALVFIAIGLFAVVIARQITAPLNFIQQSLSRTIYGKKNEPIKWDRNDEIGALVKEYNQMIAALENSAQRLAQSERESAWREMAKQVAHEIKNPLTPLKLGLQLLDKSWKDKDPKFDQKFERFSKSFVEQIESLSSIASEFSAFAKMPDTRIEPLNVFDVLTQAVTIFKQMDNVKIVYLPPSTPFMINADRDQLLRCFNNLLKNAIEASPASRVGVIEVNYLITSKNILLTIHDNGNGIPEELREKIFEPNFTTKSSGTGLGLAFVKNSIENAGGKVWFETVVNEGTTFYLSLPLV
ncbi:HAMP domain-containing protein [Mucilaginibacter frigoritolerans]|uniref:histidine kinase n=1 Tax=Mucilaginibacter frigoritolerans TaxID=652788 RepID=A0A562TUG1_9SPHI|nr:ATP-binding protein [Mucilaginibacter frigoritolerans]TWI97259.1 HAMP domain-containing protein [Mucilaginibacter frigoritolerans]